MRLFCLQIAQLPSQFQSTHPNTRCDSAKSFVISFLSLISIHAPQYEVRLCSRNTHRLHAIFQSTHPNTRCDRITTLKVHKVANFNPRTPIRGATVTGLGCAVEKAISIHAPQYEVRLSVSTIGVKRSKISIHAPQYEVRQF